MRPTAIDPNGSITVLEAMLSYGETKRSPTYTDTLVDEAKITGDLWGLYTHLFLEAGGVSIDGLVVHPSDNETRMFGCHMKDGRLVRVAVGDSTPLPLYEMVNKQLALASSFDLGRPTRFADWLSVVGAMKPAIAHRRPFMPVFGEIVGNLAYSGYSVDMPGFDGDWIDLIDGIAPAYEELDNALRAGLTEQQVSETIDRWSGAFERSRRKTKEKDRQRFGY